jgi:hypothetical protein
VFLGFFGAHGHEGPLGAEVVPVACRHHLELVALPQPTIKKLKILKNNKIHLKIVE